MNINAEIQKVEGLLITNIYDSIIIEVPILFRVKAIDLLFESMRSAFKTLVSQVYPVVNIAVNNCLE